MGMFDDITCKYPLPVAGANELSFQTKDTPAQMLDKYEIREDGTLWHEDYDVEDHTAAADWVRANPGKTKEDAPAEMQEGFNSIAGLMTRVNKRWEPMDFTGEISFYDCLGEKCEGWIEFSAYFEHGKIVRLNLIELRKLQ